MSVPTTRNASGGFDVKLTTTAPLSPLSIEGRGRLGAGVIELRIDGYVSELSAGGITAAGLQILGSGTVRLDSATNNVTTLAADHTGSISYTDADSLSVGSVTDTAMPMSVSTTEIAISGLDVKQTANAALSPLSIEAPET